MNNLNLASSIQSYLYNSALSIDVAYPVHLVVYSKSRINFYSYNPPLDYISIIIHNQEDYMSFKNILNKKYTNLLKNTILIGLVIVSSYSLIFSEQTEIESEKGQTITIMPINGPCYENNEILYNLLSIRLANISELKLKSLEGKIFNTYLKKTINDKVYTNMSIHDYEQFIINNIQHIKSDYILISNISKYNDKSILFIKVLDKKGILVAGKEFYFDYKTKDIINSIDKICSEINNNIVQKKQTNNFLSSEIDSKQ